jgi:hypothetical protein
LASSSNSTAWTAPKPSIYLTYILTSNTNLGNYVIATSLATPVPNYSYNNYSIQLEKWFCIQDSFEPNNQMPGTPYVNLDASYTGISHLDFLKTMI